MVRGTDAPPAMRASLERLVGPLGDRALDEVDREVHHRLGRSPAVLALATLEDLLEVEDRPNQPGTTDDERPNWSRALPVLVDDLPDHPAPPRRSPRSPRAGVTSPFRSPKTTRWDHGARGRSDRYLFRTNRPFGVPQPSAPRAPRFGAPAAVGSAGQETTMGWSRERDGRARARGDQGAALVEFAFVMVLLFSSSSGSSTSA